MSRWVKPAVQGRSQTLDVKSMSDEGLISLLNQIEAELQSRGYQKVAADSPAPQVVQASVEHKTPAGAPQVQGPKANLNPDGTPKPGYIVTSKGKVLKKRPPKHAGKDLGMLASHVQVARDAFTNYCKQVGLLYNFDRGTGCATFVAARDLLLKDSNGEAKVTEGQVVVPGEYPGAFPKFAVMFKTYDDAIDALRKARDAPPVKTGVVSSDSVPVPKQSGSKSTSSPVSGPPKGTTAE